MPRLCREIPTCVHNQVNNTLSFTRNGTGAIAEGNLLSLYNVASEGKARRLVAWFNELVERVAAEQHPGGSST